MQQVEAHTLRSFTKDGQGGNNAGVVLDLQGQLSPEQRQRIAAELGHPETAFGIFKRGLRRKLHAIFHTPEEEVVMCGHGTVALLSHLHAQGKVPAGVHKIRTGMGETQAHIRDDGVICYVQNEPRCTPDDVDINRFAAVLETDVTNIASTGIPPRIVETVGSDDLRDLLLPIRGRDDLEAVSPNADRIADICRKHRVAGIHLFTLDTIEQDAIAHSRNFSPAVGIPEEAATGTTTGALAAHLYMEGLMQASFSKLQVFEQGHSIGSPSEILVNLDNAEGELFIMVGGRAQHVRSDRITVP